MTESFGETALPFWTQHQYDEMNSRFALAMVEAPEGKYPGRQMRNVLAADGPFDTVPKRFAGYTIIATGSSALDW
jgi:hypothetical protein